MSELKIGEEVPASPIKKKRKRNYVNNPDFLQALKDYKAICLECDKIDMQRPAIPKYIGECIFIISTRISTRKNFSGYAFREDMIMDGVETCFRYIDRFNADKYDNPFGFFSIVIWRAFLQRIAKEKRQLYLKYKNSQLIHISGGSYYNDSSSDTGISSGGNDIDYMNAYIEEYEEKVAEKKKKLKETKDGKKKADKNYK